jgi:hypothetical protein
MEPEHPSQPAETYVERADREIKALGAISKRSRLWAIVIILAAGLYGLYLLGIIPPHQKSKEEKLAADILRQAKGYQDLSEQYRAAKEELAKTQKGEYEAKIARLESQLQESKSKINDQVERLDADPRANGGVSLRTTSTQAIQAWQACINANPSGVPISGCYSILTNGLDTVVKTSRQE